QRLGYIAALNDSELWIQGLADLLERHLLGWDASRYAQQESNMTTPNHPGQQKKPAKHAEKKLDEAIEDTFPASDPVPPDAGKPSGGVKKVSQEDEQENELDDALEDTFPASDPVSINAPHRSH